MSSTRRRLVRFRSAVRLRTSCCTRRVRTPAAWTQAALSTLSRMPPASIASEARWSAAKGRGRAVTSTSQGRPATSSVRTRLERCPGASQSAMPSWGSAASLSRVLNTRLAGSGRAAAYTDITMLLSPSRLAPARALLTRALAARPAPLRRNRSEAGVSMSLHDETSRMTNDAMAQLNSLTGPQFDTAYANAVMRAETAAVAQYGAYSQSGGSGPLKRYAQESLPILKELSEYSKRLAGGR